MGPLFCELIAVPFLLPARRPLGVMRAEKIFDVAAGRGRAAPELRQRRPDADVQCGMM